MASPLLKGLKFVVVFAYGLLSLILYGVTAVKYGLFFRKSTEKDHLELQLARNRFWDLSQEFSGLTHHFLTLRSGFKFHYLSNDTPGATTASGSKKPLLILIHGFPDSWAIWRHIINSKSLQSTATVVAVDMPGYGGTDSLDKYSATNVLENMTEFIIAVRAKFGIDDDDSDDRPRTVIVAHDWGCVVAMRLAAEAPQLADRFILSNGPLPSMVASNIGRILSSSIKMFKTALRSPIQSRSTLIKAIQTMSPVLRQVKRSGYIFAMQLPMPFVRYLGTGGNYSFLKMIHIGSHGGAEFTARDAADCMASSLGPSIEECKTKTADGEEYPASVKNARAHANYEHMASYYRHGAAVARWHKSIETIADLHSIARGNELRRTSSGAGVFDDGPNGVLKASSTIIWGKNDIALEPQLCLDGFSDYLVSKSQVVMLPRSGHFTPVERESRLALEKIAEWAAKGEREDVGAVVEACYSNAVVTVRK